MQTFGEQLAEIIKLDKTTVTDVAKRSGISYATIYNILQKGKVPSFMTIGRIVAALKLEVILVRPEREPLGMLTYKPKKPGNVPKDERPTKAPIEGSDLATLGEAIDLSGLGFGLD